jgi:hypothetical protein
LVPTFVRARAAKRYERRNRDTRVLPQGKRIASYQIA